MPQPDISGQNEHYIGARLSYLSSLEDADNTFGDLYLADLVRLFLTITAIWFALSTFVVLPGTIIVFIVAWASGLLDVLGQLWYLFFLVYPALYLGLWLFPNREFAGRWELSFDDQAQLVEPSILLVFSELQAKRLPAGASVRKQQHSTSEERFYIVLDRGEFHAYISALPFGTDLYVTWAMWRHRPPIMAVIRYLSDAFRTVTGRGSVLPKVSRNDPERALREAIHDSVRAGVEKALSGGTATVAGTFGSNVTIGEESGPTFDSLAPPPGAAATAPGPAAPTVEPTLDLRVDAPAPMAESTDTMSGALSPTLAPAPSPAPPPATAPPPTPAPGPTPAPASAPVQEEDQSFGWTRPAPAPSWPAPEPGVAPPPQPSPPSGEERPDGPPPLRR